MAAVKQNYGEKVLVQVSNKLKCTWVYSKLIKIWGSSHAFCAESCSLKILLTTMLLSCLQSMAQLIWSSMMIYRYEMVQLLIVTWVNFIFISDILLILLLQGTASVVLAGVIAALKLLGGSLADHTFLFLGAGEVRFAILNSSFSVSSPNYMRILMSGSIWFWNVNRGNVAFGFKFLYSPSRYKFRCLIFGDVINSWKILSFHILSNMLVLQAGTGIAELIALEMSKRVCTIIMFGSSLIILRM